MEADWEFLSSGADQVTVSVQKSLLGEDWPVARSCAKRLLKRAEKFERVVFDFRDVEQIGPAFADEIFRVFALQHPEVELVAVNTHVAVKKIVAKARNDSAARYAAVRQSVGEPDPFRMRHRAALREVVGAVVRERMNKRQASAHVHAWAQEQVAKSEYPRFCEIAEKILLGLHEGNFAPYGIRPEEFAAWRKRWKT